MSGPGWPGLRWLAGGVVATLLLAGCSDDEPRAEPPRPRAPSTSPVTTTSPTPEPPVLPSAARRNTKAGAVAFAHHYIDLVNHAATTGDTGALGASSDPECEGCAGLIRSVDNIYSRGGWIHTSGWRPKSWSSFGQSSPNEREITVVVRMPSERRKASETATVTESKPSKGIVNFRVRYTAHRWTTAEMGLM